MKKRIMVIGAVVAASGVTALGVAGVTHAAAAGSVRHGIVRHMEGVMGDAKLSQAVRDGVITEAQKQAFLTEEKTLKAEHKAAVTKDSTKAEREAERTKLKTELKAWASTNNFPLAKIFPHLAQ